jgi:hypothetical protein
MDVSSVTSDTNDATQDVKNMNLLQAGHPPEEKGLHLWSESEGEAMPSFGFRLAGFSVASLEFSHSALNLEEKSTSDIKQFAQLINSLDRRYVHRQFNCNITNPS